MKKNKYIYLSIIGILILVVMFSVFVYLNQGKKNSDNGKVAVNQNETLETEKVTPEETSTITEAFQEDTSITEALQENTSATESIQEETTQKEVIRNEEVTTKESSSKDS